MTTPSYRFATDPIRVACPKCKADVGDLCVSLRPRVTAGVRYPNPARPHAERLAAAKAKGEYYRA